MRFAAIDVGSNAARLLLSQVIENGGSPVFKKESLIRYPLRLGDDSFLLRRITPEKSGELVKILKAFRYLMEAYRPISSRACATSALREAENRAEIIRAVRDESRIDLEVIDGRTEAQIITQNHVERNLDPNSSYLYIDVGGGSTQLSFFEGKTCLESRSFNIGAIRLLRNVVSPASWKDMKKWLKQKARDLTSIAAIGSGGNINKIFMLAGKKLGQPLSLKKMRTISRFLKRFDTEERIRVLGLRPDRADVIVPALDISLRVMKWAVIDHVYVPFIGLSDGLIHMLYEEHKRVPGSNPAS